MNQPTAPVLCAAPAAKQARAGTPTNQQITAESLAEAARQLAADPALRARCDAANRARYVREEARRVDAAHALDLRYGNAGVVT
ncbi:hypothetical protein [Polaromonas sp.]|uniref:hypothetical protein n=1 Tax=Polaromonas sp. TaxID=1869339 RepID=UPI0032658C71